MYSQYDEEKYALEAFSDSDGRVQGGRFLDVGAWHPRQFSNTRALFELGWSGVMVEPSPGPMLYLLAEYGEEPRITLILGAVACEPGLVKLHITDDAVSTSNEAEYQKWKDTAKFRGSLVTPGIPLEYFATRFGGFDFINIDAEGASVDLFLQMLKLGWQPKCLCVEHENRLEEVCSAATPQHFNLVYANGTNAVLVRK